MGVNPAKVKSCRSDTDDEHQSHGAKEQPALQPTEGRCTTRHRFAGLGVTLHPLEIGASVRGMLITQVPVFLQAFANDLVEFGWDVWVNSHRGYWRALQNRVENQGRRLPSKWKGAGTHLIQHCAE